ARSEIGHQRHHLSGYAPWLGDVRGANRDREVPARPRGGVRVSEQPGWARSGSAANGSARPPRPLRAPETRLEGYEVETPHGPVWCARAAYDLDFLHGRSALGRALAWDRGGLARASRMARAAELAPTAWAFLD